MKSDFPAEPPGAQIEDLPSDPNAMAVADELRAIATALSDLDLPSEVFADALPLARELRARFAGPRRARWYDLEARSPTASLEARRSYQDLSPLRGLLNPVAPPMTITREEHPDGVRLVAHARLSCAYEGPPHGVHGGVVAAMFDEILGAAQNLAPPVGVTAKLEVRYRHITPIEEDLRFESWVSDDRERRIVIRATCHAGETLTADATGLFVRVDFDELQQYMRARREGAG